MRTAFFTGHRYIPVLLSGKTDVRHELAPSVTSRPTARGRSARLWASSGRGPKRCRSAAGECHVERGQGVQPGGREVGDAEVSGLDKQFDLRAASNDPLGSALLKPVDDLEVAGA